VPRRDPSLRSLSLALSYRDRIALALSQALAGSEYIYALEFRKGNIVSGCWELKRKFRFISIGPNACKLTNFLR